VTEVYFSPFGRFIVTLANGQIWRQLDGDAGRARFSKQGGDTCHDLARPVSAATTSWSTAITAMFKVARIKG
jgi:hypothetical protein